MAAPAGMEKRARRFQLVWLSGVSEASAEVSGASGDVVTMHVLPWVHDRAAPAVPPNIRHAAWTDSVPCAGRTRIRSSNAEHHVSDGMEFQDFLRNFPSFICYASK
ncbi:hypothetical protein GCM10027590_64800 [Nocardiopsis nanhaiensis]